MNRIASTRDMCNALKDHSIKIDGAICKGQEDKDHLMLINRDTMFKYQVRYQLSHRGIIFTIPVPLPVLFMWPLS